MSPPAPGPRRSAGPGNQSPHNQSVDTVRLAVVLALCRVGREGEFSAATDTFLARRDVSHLDKAFFQEVSYGVLRNLAAIDRVLAAFLKGDISNLPLPILNTLRSGTYQLLYLDRVPASAAVNESVKIAGKLGHKGTAGLVNAVLRRVAEQGRRIIGMPVNEEPVAALAIGYSHPEWLVRRWVDRYGLAGAETLLKSDNTAPPLVLRANRLKGTPQELVDRLKAENVIAELTELSPAGVRVREGNPFDTKLFGTGWFYVQDEGAQLVSLLLNPQPGEVIMDLCAAPGGKATHLAELMGNVGRVIAVDNNRKRLTKVTETAKRLGLSSIETVEADVSAPSPALSVERADKILVDAPCSGLGVLRRHPEARWERSESDILRLRRRQLAILKNSASFLRKGGVLVYATCSTEPEENMGVLLEFLADRADMAIEPPASFLPPLATEMVRDGLCLETTGNLFGMDSFFAVRLVRRAD